jgi:hypothetical protein
MRRFQHIISFCFSLLTALPLLAQLMAGKAGLSQPMSWRIEKQTTLTINGKSNVSGIACDNKDYDRSDTLVMMKTINGDSISLNGMLAMEIVDFNCHNFLFTSHLRKILKIDEYPHMVIRFVRIDKIPIVGNSCTACGVVEISLAGVTRRFTVPIEFAHQPSNRATLVGSRKFRLEDFDLKPPPKVPFVKVKNEFVVEFNLALTRVR